MDETYHLRLGQIARLDQPKAGVEIDHDSVLADIGNYYGQCRDVLLAGKMISTVLGCKV